MSPPSPVSDPIVEHDESMPALGAALNAPVVLGHDAVERLVRAVEAVLPTLRQGPPRMLPNGGVEVRDPYVAEALHVLQSVLEDELPPAVVRRIVLRSGLAFPIFLGHVLDFWVAQRERIGLLRAFVDRAALHGVDMRLHWNEGRERPVRALPEDIAPLAVGTALGFAVGAVVHSYIPWDSVLPLLCAGLGFTAGHVWRRVVVRYACGDRLCQAPLPARATRCPSCGATPRLPGRAAA